jgi:4-hydroxybenzoyl-CoA reductase alpha subunit
MNSLSVVGKRVLQINAKEKVTGKMLYSDDLILPRILYGKVLRSPYAHARIVDIQTGEADKLQGVKAVITAKDTPRIRFINLGFPFEDKLPLEAEKVRYAGDEVAAVAAVSEAIAEEAIRRIHVTYELLPAVFDPEKAMEEGAPQVHEGKSNIILHRKRDFGNVNQAFQESDFIFEDCFETQAVSHCNLEPRCSVAKFDVDGNLTIWTSTQSPYYVRKEVSHVLGLPISKVIVREIQAGGGFGSRSKVCEDEAISAFLALKTGCPVKITYNRQEEFSCTRVRLPFKIWIKTGVKKDGTLLAREVKAVADKGAYCQFGPAIVTYAEGVVSSLYRVPNVQYEIYLVYTNKHYGGPFRGFGAPQVTFAIESQMDMIAKKLEMDPMELRLKNANRSGETTPCGWKITSCGFTECICKAAEISGWVNKRKLLKDNGDVVRGIGMASGIHLSGAKVFADGDYSGAIIKVFEDGFIQVYKGSPDMGTWSNTTIAQIVAEAMNVPFEKVHVISMDTEVTPTDLGSFASRVIFIHGNASLKAALKVKRKLLEAAASVLESNVEDFEISDGWIHIKGKPDKGISYGDAVKNCKDRLCSFVMDEYHYDPPSEVLDRQTGYSNISAAYTFATQIAEVEVNKRTGLVRVVGFTAAHDVGRAINPTAVEGQIQGGVAQGIGFALLEGFCYQEGKVLNPNFRDYRIPTAKDIPPIQTILIETDDPEGPFGAKGVGELSLNPTAAAIANAVYDAIGIQIKNLPILPEKIYGKLKDGVSEQQNETNI